MNIGATRNIIITAATTASHDSYYQVLPLLLLPLTTNLVSDPFERASGHSNSYPSLPIELVGKPRVYHLRRRCGHGLLRPVRLLCY